MIYNIRGYFGGLGDQLQFTSLPQRFTEAGHEVYLYNGPDVQPYRNAEIKSLLWGTNPYIIGASDKKWNAGDIPSRVLVNSTGNHIQNWEVLHGLPRKDTLPKIYHNPNEIKGVDVVIELSGISLMDKYDREAVIKTVSKLIHVYRYNRNFKIRQIVSLFQNNPIVIPGVELMKVTGLFRMWDVVCSAKVLITLNSGTHSLAAAAQEYNDGLSHTCIIPASEWDWIMKEQRFIFPNISYIKEK